MTEAFQAAYLTPEEQDRQREEVLRMDLSPEQLQREGEEEQTRFEQGREVTRLLVREFMVVYRRDQWTGVMLLLAALGAFLLAFDLLTAILHILVTGVHALFNLVHTWLTAHR